MSNDLLVFNGIDGATGAYLLPPIAPNTLSDIIIGANLKEANLQELRWRFEQTQLGSYALKAGLDPDDLAEAGWGIVFPAKADRSVCDALRDAFGELLTLRKSQAGSYYKEYYGTDGYRTGESKLDWLVRQKASPGAVDPERVPFYLLIVGDPQSIPYRFQYELDVAYAVGRIHFKTLDEYAHYARSVLIAETSKNVQLPHHATFFGTKNPGDRATALSAEHLVKPLAEKLGQADDLTDWRIETLIGAESTKQCLYRHLGEEKTPALLFTASHGVGFPNGDNRQFPLQGALVCQDWPGPQYGGIAREHYLAAEDIGDDARLLGLIAFHFACFGVGTPYWDAFARQAFKTRTALAPHPFVAAMPQRLLGHPKGGALAVVGHVERAWSCSFRWEGAVRHTSTFESVLRYLMKGHRIGVALDFLNLRYAELATILSNELDEAEYRQPDPYKLASLWTANNDARGFALLGDPAVYLPILRECDTSSERPRIQSVGHIEGELPTHLDPVSTPHI